jgi:predicted ATPase
VICKAFGAIALWLLGFPDAARRQSEDAIVMSRDHSPTSQSIALHFAAMLAQLGGDPERTRDYAEASAQIATEHGLSFWLAGGGVMAGWSLVAMGQTDDGIAQLRQGLHDWQATGSATYRTYYLGLLAEAIVRAGSIGEAQSVLDEALTLIERTDERFFEAELHRLRGELWLKTLNQLTSEAAAPARAAFHRALDVSRLQEANALRLRAAISLARLDEQVGVIADSQNLLREICITFAPQSESPDLRDALSLIKPRDPS